ncbi:thermonuclease family protein [Brucella sp. 458]|uniref:thermonuclease family protein n=1 Tax=Brucella sp. 458 TaxID=2821140 RepID=UPI001ADFA060|nr:thermonuclease family protein [Brucella sp. 458]QTN98937.1 thermonuclease family protein [Brucella sp. 458]
MRQFMRPYRHTSPAPRRRKVGGFLSILLTLLLFFILGLLIFHLPANQPDRHGPSGRPYIIDGDTVALGKTHIRLKGIDAPEIGQSCEGAHGTYDCGGEARNKLRSYIGRTSIRCESSGRDRYDRVLARCFLGETDLNQWMVQEGWAVSYGNYQRDEADARRDKRGIWAGKFERPSRWRKEHPHPKRKQP